MTTGSPVHLPKLMNKPFDTPPDFTVIDNVKYNINTDFRIWIEISEMLSQHIPLKEKLCFLLVNGYCDKLPPNIDTAINALLTFMNMNDDSSHSSGKEHIFSFTQDKNLIYAAFRQQYGIDLFRDNLHWWDFMILLSTLDENTAFMRIVGYRSVDCSKIKDENRKKFYRRMKNKYRLKRIVDEIDIADTLSV